MIVVDASAVIELLFFTQRGQEVADRLSLSLSLSAPHLLDVEVAQVVRRYEAAGSIPPPRAAQAITDLADLDLERYSHQVMLPRIWALRHNLTAYDAAYVSLAEVLEAPLLTCDARLAAAPGHDARIELVA